MAKKAEKIMMPMQEGDVKQTWANVDGLAEVTGHRPKTDIVEGVGEFVEWYKGYSGI